MHASQPSLLMRHDTLLGICEALGEDFGFNPLYLRITFSVLILLSPVAVISTYLGAGVVVLLSRLIFPKPRRAAAAVQAEVPVSRPAPARAVRGTVDQDMLIAA